MTGRLDGVFSGPPGRSVVELLRAWWAIEVAALSDDTPHPPILHQMWEAEAHLQAWGHQNVLLPPGRVNVRDHGAVEFFVENQSVWSCTYLPDGGPDPRVAAIVDGDDGPESQPLGISLHEFLARSLSLEAVFGGAWCADGRLTAENDVARLLVWPELAVDADRVLLPAIYSDESTVCLAFGAEFAFYGAATREELASSTFTGLGDWSEPNQSEGPYFALG